MEKLTGKGVVGGIAIGRLKVLADELPEHLAMYQHGSANSETSKALAAIAEAKADLEEAVARNRQSGFAEQADIMEAHLMIAGDPTLEEGIREKIAAGAAAPQAVIDVCEENALVFEAMDDTYFRERAADIRDIGRRIVRRILGLPAPDLGRGPVVLCGHEIEPSVLATAPAGVVKGIMLGQGSTTSHAVIIAKARGIVTVVGLADAHKKFSDGVEIIVDGYTGEVLTGYDEKIAIQYQAKAEAEAARRERDLADASLPAVTKDGIKVHLAANIGLPQDIDSAVTLGAQGVGLYRTEFLFMGRVGAPSEEEQYEAYKAVIEKCGDHLCIIRTMDIGGDKPLPYLAIGHEDNPFLGLRAIRISLNRTDLFLAQLKAILRASVYGKAAIMLPMVVNVSEIRQAKAVLQQAMNELDQAGIAYGKVPLGIMVETPAAAANAAMLAKECDFFSIGTNDLVQYTLAVDRVNPNVSYLYNHFHPAVLRLIKNTIDASHEAGIWTGMCGEMASDPLATALLVGLGIDELSMSAPSLPRVKEVIRSITTEQAKAVAAQVLEMDDGDKIKDFLAQVCIN